MKPQSLTLTKKATLAAAATGAVFGLQHHADAAIVYSGAQNVTASIGVGFGSSFKPVDLDGWTLARKPWIVMISMRSGRSCPPWDGSASDQDPKRR